MDGTRDARCYSRVVGVRGREEHKQAEAAAMGRQREVCLCLAARRCEATKKTLAATSQGRQRRSESPELGQPTCSCTHTVTRRAALRRGSPLCYFRAVHRCCGGVNARPLAAAPVAVGSSPRYRARAWDAPFFGFYHPPNEQEQARSAAFESRYGWICDRP